MQILNDNHKLNTPSKHKKAAIFIDENLKKKKTNRFIISFKILYIVLLSEKLIFVRAKGRDSSFYLGDCKSFLMLIEIKFKFFFIWKLN